MNTARVGGGGRTTMAAEYFWSRRRQNMIGNPHQDETLPLANQQSGRKRHVEELDDEESVENSSSVDNLTASIQETSIVNMQPPSRLQKLRLEAIFLPKFENETRNNQDIRRRMKERVTSNDGYLEVSLKQSGSLLLWSGGQRFYSKNATENQFTHVGEIILRQHFFRAWYNEKGTSAEQAFQECSSYILQNRLTLAFELVTSILGHHGDIPKKDFLILTAVADKQAERFYSTSEVVALAQKFRLPHNDSWVFAESSSVEALFRLYDTTRETGLADSTIRALSESADSHVCSMYPHVDFQGNILEGIVIRFVAYGNDGREQQLESMNRLARASMQILASVPPETPPSFDLVTAEEAPSKTLPPVLTTNVRDIFDRCLVDTPSGKRLNDENFREAVGTVLAESDGKDQRRTVARWSGEKDGDRVNLPDMVEQMQCHDNESERIAKMISTLDGLRGPVAYKIFREVEPQGSRWLCIVQVHSDVTFQKFHKRRNEGEMALFRGCCLELLTEDSSSTATGRCDAGVPIPKTELRGKTNEDDTLILKMKFLPYMIRTFVCRNGLSVLKSGGPDAFDQFAINLLKKWEISQGGMKKWQPFFHSWALYAYDNMEGSASKTHSDGNLLQLNAMFYLDHFERFRDLYDNNHIKTTGKRKTPSAFRGAVIVVSWESETADRFASYLSVELDGVRQRNDIGKISEGELIISIAPQGAGVIYSGSVGVGVKSVRQQLKKFRDSIFVVLVDCDMTSMKVLEQTDKDRAMLYGKAQSWRKNACAVLEVSGIMPSIQSQEDFRENKDVKAILRRLWSLSKAVSQPDTRPGLLMYFPAIPGSGKSTLCNSKTNQELEHISSDLASLHDGNSAEPKRTVSILEGDKMNKKYWQHVKQKRDMDPSSVIVADKNSPPTAWISIGNAFSTSAGVAVAVLPDDVAVQTTAITGARLKNGVFDRDIVNYYPFSLHYLAVCMSRVLDRPAGSHNGNLDGATKHACMIVASFFGLYRRIAADQFVDALKMGTEKTGAMSSMPPIRVPFFAEKSLPPLPPDLEAALIEALQVQVGWEKKSGKNKQDEQIDRTEDRLRKVIGAHKEMLDGLSVDPEESRQSFVAQVKSRMQGLDGLQVPLEPSRPFIKIVSVDVNVTEVHELLKSCAESSESAISRFLVACDEGKEEESRAEMFSGPGFIKNTHVTMAHHNNVDQKTMRENYDAVEGHPVEVTANGLLWGERVAALSATIASATNDEHKLSVPGPSNTFSHITVWRATGESAVLSNQLPKMVADGKAQQIDFKDPITLNGVISYWSSDKTS